MTTLEQRFDAAMRRADFDEGRMRRCISVRQPWAMALVLGIKDVENRSWPTSYRGPLLIHAGKTLDEDGVYAISADLLTPWTDASRAKLRDAGVLSVRDLTLGAIIGRVDLVDCVRNSQSRWANHETGTWHWCVRNAERFATPVTFSGRLGIFGVPRERVPR